VGQEGLEGFVIRLSKKCAEIALDEPVEILTNFKMNLKEVDENLATKSFYAKVIEYPGKNEKIHRVRFTSLPSEVDAYFQSHRQHATKLHPTESS